MTESLLLEQAVAHHQAGQLDAAEHLYRAVLALDPDRPEAHHGLGVLAMTTGRIEQGLEHLERALEADPETGHYWQGFAEALLLAGRPAEALATIERAMAMGLDTPEARALRDQLQSTAATNAKTRPTATQPRPTAPRPPNAQPQPQAAQAPSSPKRRAIQVPKNWSERHAPGLPTPTAPPAEQLALVRLLQARDFAAAETACRRFIERHPQDPLGWRILVSVYGQTDQPEAALAVIELALRGLPEDVELLNGQGNVLKALGRIDEALDAYRQALRLQPTHAEAAYNLGIALQELGRFAEALDAYRQAVTHKPALAAAHNNLGNVLRSLGRAAEAPACYRQALAIRPDHAEAHTNLGNTLYDLGRLDEALDCYNQALALDPNLAAAHSNLGMALKALGRLDEALDCYAKALALKPDSAEAHNNLANVLQTLGRQHEALEHYRQALAIRPGYATAYSNLGSALKELGEIDEALACYDRALALCPTDDDAVQNRLFTLNYHPDQSAEDIFAAYREYDRQFGLPHRAAWLPHGNDRDPDRRLRVGYVSPDFRQHSMRGVLEPLLAGHDRESFEIAAYAELSKEDAVTARYRACVDRWVSTAGIGDDALAERIRADGIDILVDLAGHTAGNRLGVFARKPAPVSLSCFGFGYTTGLSAIDYYLADPIIAPPGSEHLFAETPWRLSGPAGIYRPAAGMGEPGTLPALSRGYLTFGTLSRSVRINHRTIRVWAEILRRVPESRLVVDSLNYGDPATRDTLAARFADHGIGRERLELGYRSPPWDVLRTIDIGLDCFPHNSGTTLVEHLYMGMPFVTLAGRPSVGRIGASALTHLGHPEWIADREDGYVEIAAALASDLDRLADLRMRLRGEMQSSPLMDEAGFVHRLEQAYRDMWRRWCESDRQ